MKKNGFSLVEVMLIFMVMSVILAASIPGISKKTNAIPFKLQQGAYYCYYDNGRLREMYYTKDQLTSDRFVDHCVFNPPKRASIFRIDVFGAGAGGTDYVKVTNPDDQPTAAYKMAEGLVGESDKIFNRLFREGISENLLKAYFGGKTIQVTVKGETSGESGQDVVGYKLVSCGCERYGWALWYTDDDFYNCAKPNEWNCTYDDIVGYGGYGGDPSYVSASFTIPTDYWDYKDMLKRARRYVSRTHENDNGYQGNERFKGRKRINYDYETGESGRDVKHNLFLQACVPNQWISGQKCFTNNNKYPTGGQGGSITCTDEGCYGDDYSEKKGTTPDNVGDGDGTNYIPMLLMQSFINARHYEWGNPGTNGTHLRKLRFGLKGPCNIQIHPGGDVVEFVEFGATYPTAVDLQTVVSCSNYTLTALGGTYSSTLASDDRWYERGKNEYEEETFGGNQPDPFAFSTLFYRYPNAAQPQNMMGRGGQGSGFVDKCSQRFTGYYREMIIDEGEYAASGGYVGRAPLEPGGLNAHDNQYYQLGYKKGRENGKYYADAVSTGTDQTWAYNRWFKDEHYPTDIGMPRHEVEHWYAGFTDGFMGAANNNSSNPQTSPAAMGYSGFVSTGEQNSCVDNMPAGSNGCYQELPASNCLDDNEYGTVPGYYDLIPATKGQPGGVVIIW